MSVKARERKERRRDAQEAGTFPRAIVVQIPFAPLLGILYENGVSQTFPMPLPEGQQTMTIFPSAEGFQLAWEYLASVLPQITELARKQEQEGALTRALQGIRAPVAPSEAEAPTNGDHLHGKNGKEPAANVEPPVSDA